MSLSKSVAAMFRRPKVEAQIDAQLDRLRQGNLNNGKRVESLLQRMKGEILTTDFAVRANGSFQSRVKPWLVECFGAQIADDKEERTHRFVEEALELAQACGATKDEARLLVDYVFDRPIGEKEQEVGGVMVTLAALCLAQGLDMGVAGETELARVWTKVEAIRAKQKAKPKFSPLPAAPKGISKTKLIGYNYHTARAIMHDRFPLAFPARKMTVPALKIGISKDLIQAGLPMSPSEIRTFMHHWTHRPEYYAAVAHSFSRIGLYGGISGPVSDEHSRQAAECLQRFRARKTVKKIAIAAPQSASPPAMTCCCNGPISDPVNPYSTMKCCGKFVPFTSEKVEARIKRWRDDALEHTPPVHRSAFPDRTWPNREEDTDKKALVERMPQFKQELVRSACLHCDASLERYGSSDGKYCLACERNNKLPGKGYIPNRQ